MASVESSQSWTIDRRLHQLDQTLIESGGVSNKTLYEDWSHRPRHLDRHSECLERQGRSDRHLGNRKSAMFWILEKSNIPNCTQIAVLLKSCVTSLLSYWLMSPKLEMFGLLLKPFSGYLSRYKSIEKGSRIFQGTTRACTLFAQPNVSSRGDRSIVRIGSNKSSSNGNGQITFCHYS